MTDTNTLTLAQLGAIRAEAERGTALLHPHRIIALCDMAARTAKAQAAMPEECKLMPKEPPPNVLKEGWLASINSARHEEPMGADGYPETRTTIPLDAIYCAFYDALETTQAAERDELIIRAEDAEKERDIHLARANELWDNPAIVTNEAKMMLDATRERWRKQLARAEAAEARLAAVEKKLEQIADLALITNGDDSDWSDSEAADAYAKTLERIRAISIGKGEEG